MNLQILFILVAFIALGAFFYAPRRLKAKMGGGVSARPHSLPLYYGSYAALWCLIPAGIIAILWQILTPMIVDAMLMQSLSSDYTNLPKGELGLFMNNVHNHLLAINMSDDPMIINAAIYLGELQGQAEIIGSLSVFAFAIAGVAFGISKIHPLLRARNQVEKVIISLMVLASLIAILTTIGIIVSLLYEAMRFFASIPLHDFIFGTQWSPQIALREGQVGASGSFGAIPIFAGTLLITIIAMMVAAPIGLYTAIYLSEYAGPKMRNYVKPALEILAGVPTVVYGFFAALTVAPFFRNLGISFGLDVSSQSALAAGLVMGIMIIPFVSSLSDDVISAVPNSLREAALGLGSTRAEMIKIVIFPAALPGIVGALLLAVSRAIGETMIVVMAAGLAANLTANPLNAVTTVTVQIVTLLVGDQEFDSPKTLAAFALGLVLFVVTLTLNIIALHIVRKYREQYD